MNIYTKVAEITNESVKDYKNHALPNHVVGRQEIHIWHCVYLTLMSWILMQR